jgi:hypothetical protein
MPAKAEVKLGTETQPPDCLTALRDPPRSDTLAHLLGHYFLHAVPGRSFVEDMFVGGHARVVRSRVIPSGISS